jgi:hypothetical protein
MSEDNYDLNNIIINIFNETIKWLKDNNIGIRRLSLSIREATESLQQNMERSYNDILAGYMSQKRIKYGL